MHYILCMGKSHKKCPSLLLKFLCNNWFILFKVIILNVCMLILYLTPNPSQSSLTTTTHFCTERATHFQNSFASVEPSTRLNPVRRPVQLQSISICFSICLFIKFTQQKHDANRIQMSTGEHLGFMKIAFSIWIIEKS